MTGSPGARAASTVRYTSDEYVIGRRNLKGNEAQYAVRYMSYMSESPERGETWSATPGSTQS